jgi:hypothetical protein
MAAIGGQIMYESVSCVEAINRLMKDNQTIMLSPAQYSTLVAIFGSQEVEESIVYVEKNCR